MEKEIYREPFSGAREGGRPTGGGVAVVSERLVVYCLTSWKL